MRARLLVVPAMAAFAAVLGLAATALVAGSVRPGQGSGTAQGQETQGAPRGQGRGAGAGGRRAEPPRDVAPAGTAAIAGKVVTSDTGRALKRARVVVAGGGRPRSVSTDDQGRYQVVGLPAGTYTITATKAGFVDGAFGQRRLTRTGTPVELSDGQRAANIDLKLARGGVLTGHVLDEEGEPLARAMVTVLRQQYVSGEKRLVAAGADQSDDRGQYRIFGLPPGEYYVSATAGGIDQIVRQVIGTPADQPVESSGYAPTYYPGVVTSAGATRVKLSPSQELAGLDFQIQIVPLATVKGVVVGGPATVLLVPDEGGSRGGPGALGLAAAANGRGGGRGGLGALLGGGLRGQTRQDGTFSIANVTPGKYTIVARAGGGPEGGPRTAIQPLTVTGEEVNVSLTPVPGVQVSGNMTLEAAGAPPSTGLEGFRVVVSAIGATASIPGPGRGGRPGDAGEGGHFVIHDVTAGLYMIRAISPRAWTMKSVYLDARDVTDLPIEVRSENVSGLNVIFTDKISSLSGSVRDSRGNPIADATVIAFPSDERLWAPQSRQIVTARTNASGAYRLAQLPPGDYLVVAVDEVEQGEWFDPAFLVLVKDRATKVSVAEGEQRTQDLKAPSM